MYSRKVKYEDFDGNQQEETLYFHISKAELYDLESKEETSFSKMLIELGNNLDGAKIVSTFKTLIIKSYGIKTEDGKHFKKSPSIVEDFIYSAAYDQLFTELMEDPEDALKFLAAILPLDNDQKAKIEKPLADVHEALTAEEGKENVTPLLTDNT